MGRNSQPIAGPVTLKKKERAGYDSDFYSWSQEQGRLVREGRWGEVDPDNVAEEIESLGREQFNKLERAIRIILMHILKWDHQQERRSRSWALSVKGMRVELENLLSDDPGLKPRIPEAMARAYRRARIDAAKETEKREATFPETCPYSFEEVTSRAFSYE